METAITKKKNNTVPNFETGKAHSFIFCGPNPAPLISAWKSRFQDVCKCDATVKLFSASLDVNVERVSAGFQVEACTATGISEIRGESVRHKWQPKLN